MKYCHAPSRMSISLYGLTTFDKEEAKLEFSFTYTVGENYNWCDHFRTLFDITLQVEKKLIL